MRGRLVAMRHVKPLSSPLANVTSGTAAWSIWHNALLIGAMVITLAADVAMAHRGPHHPRGEIRHIGPKVDQHLAYENQ